MLASASPRESLDCTDGRGLRPAEGRELLGKQLAKCGAAPEQLCTAAIADHTATL